MSKPKNRDAASTSELLTLLRDARESLIWHASNVPRTRREHGPVLFRLDAMIAKLESRSLSFTEQACREAAEHVIKDSGDLDAELDALGFDSLGAGRG